MEHYQHEKRDDGANRPGESHGADALSADRTAGAARVVSRRVALRPESADCEPAQTDCTPAMPRRGSRISTDSASAGLTAGRSRYVRAHPSDVRTSPITVPTGIPRGYTPPTPELTIGVPGLSALLSCTPLNSSRY